jgi:hypothetical protein
VSDASWDHAFPYRLLQCNDVRALLTSLLILAYDEDRNLPRGSPVVTFSAVTHSKERQGANRMTERYNPNAVLTD